VRILGRLYRYYWPQIRVLQTKFYVGGGSKRERIVRSERESLLEQNEDSRLGETLCWAAGWAVELTVAVQRRIGLCGSAT
jgi:hypothetical protein